MNWKYKIELRTEDVFQEIEKQRSVELPGDLKQLIREANAASPEKYRFMVGVDERIFGAVLSFNKNETEADSVFTALNVIKERNLVPFAIDPFGNYICVELKGSTVVFWNHENNMVKSLDMGVQELIDSLY